MGHLIITNTPIGGMDTDSKDSMIEPIDCRDMLNMRNSYTYIGMERNAGPVKGNVLVSFDLGNVQHKCLGTVEDKIGKSIIYFLWAANNQHKILRYYIEKVDNIHPHGQIENIITFDFGWTKSTSIHSADVVKGLLYWVDPVPHKINLDKANLNHKKKTWLVRLPKSYVVPTTTFQITIKNFATGANVAMITAFTTAGQSIKQAFESLVDQINNGNVSQYLEAETCGCDLKISEKLANTYTFTISDATYRITAENWYGPNLVARFFDAAKWAPACQPNYEYAQDPDRKYNFVFGHVWQFRLGYFYDDAETSTLSPISQIAVNNQRCNDGVRDAFNICVVDFNNPDSIDPNIWVILKKVVLYVRDRNAGPWRKVISLEPCDFFDVDGSGDPIGQYIFDNVLQTQSVDAAFSSLPFDRMPREASSQKFIENHLVYSAPLDDYNVPDCAEMNTNVTYGDVQNPEYYDVTFKIRICNPFFDGTKLNSGGIGKMPYQVGFSRFFNPGPTLLDLNKRGCLLRNENQQYPVFGGASKDNVDTNQTGFDQWCPLGGFLIYSAGTPYFGISRQFQEGGLATDEFGAFLTAGSKRDDIKAYLNRWTSTDPQGDVYQTVTIRLPKGKHIIRVASHLVSDGDVLKRGEIYDLRNNLYHLTSTNVFRFNDVDGATWVGDTELLIDVTQNQYFGEIFIADRMLPNISETNTIVRNVYGYLLDIPLFNVLGQAPKCVGMEKQTIVIDPGTRDTYNDNLPQELERGASVTYTDHNGYYFFMLYYGDARTSAFIRAYGAADQVISKRSDTKYYGDIGQIYDNKILTGGDHLDQATFGSGMIYNNPRQGNWSQSIPDDQYYNVLGQAINSTISGAVDITQTTRPVILLNTNTAFRPAYTTVITGSIKDGNGNGVCCANAVFGYNSRAAKSQDNGDFQILIFADGRHLFNISGSDPDQDFQPLSVQQLAYAFREDPLIFNTGDCFILFPTIDKLDLVIDPFGVNITSVAPPYSETAWYDVGDIVGDIVNELLIKAAKRGGKYKFTMRFQDGPGRLCSCVPLNTTTIPFFTENGQLGYPIISWALPANFIPPKWAHSYQILRSPNLILSDFLQWIVNDVKYVLALGSDNVPIETTYGNFDATQIWISVANLAEYYNQHPDSQVGFNFIGAQKIRIISNENGILEPVFTDFNILGYESTGQWIKIKYSQEIGEIKTGFRFEVYTKRKELEDEAYFECGECFPCTAPDTDLNDFSTRAGVFSWGDTYWVKRNVPIRDNTDAAILSQTIHYLESVGINDFYPSTDQDIGRVGAINDKFGEVRRTDLLRVSDNYLTLDNGLSAFRNIDDRTVGIENGPIFKLAVSGFILLAICENRAVSNYIGRVLVKGTDGNDTLQALTGQFIGDTRPMQKELGTQNPESVREFDGMVYAIDAKRGIVWRYAGNGQTEISSEHKMRNFFMYYRRNGVWFAPAIFDKLYQEYIITIYEKLFVTGTYNRNGNLLRIEIPQVPGIALGDEVFLSYQVKGELKTGYFKIDTFTDVGGKYLLGVGNLGADLNTDIIVYYKGPGKTVAWCEPKNRFTTRYSFLPEVYGVIDKDFVSMQNGKLWIHDKNEVRNNFYGVQYTSQLKPIFNKGNQVKLWLAMTIESREENGGANWSVPEITNSTNQLSRIPKTSFERKEEYLHSEFKKDLNTPGSDPDKILNGKDLRSSSLTVLLENNTIGDFYLREVFVGVEVSERNTN